MLKNLKKIGYFSILKIGSSAKIWSESESESELRFSRGRSRSRNRSWDSREVGVGVGSSDAKNRRSLRSRSRSRNFRNSPVLKAWTTSKLDDTGHFSKGFQRVRKLQYRFSLSALTVYSLRSERMSTTTSKVWCEMCSAKRSTRKIRSGERRNRSIMILINLAITQAPFGNIWKGFHA